MKSSRRAVGYAVLGAVVLLAVAVPFLSNQYWIHFVSLGLVFVIGASSLRFVYLSGQISIGQAAFMCVGAYASAVLASKFGLPVWLSVPVGTVAALAVALVVGFAFCRLTTIYFAMGTFFMGVVVQSVVAGFPKYTGGSSGLTGIPTFETISLPGGLVISFSGPSHGKYYLILLATLVCLGVLYAFERSRIGMTLKAVAQSGRVSESVGINQAGYKIFAFALGGMLTGLAGALLAHETGTLSTGSFGATTSIYLLAYVLVGGTTTFAGPIVGTVILILLPELLSNLREYTPFAVALMMILVVFVFRDGLVGMAERVGALLRGRGESLGSNVNEKKEPNSHAS